MNPDEARNFQQMPFQGAWMPPLEEQSNGHPEAWRSTGARTGATPSSTPLVVHSAEAMSKSPLKTDLMRMPFAARELPSKATPLIRIPSSLVALAPSSGATVSMVPPELVIFLMTVWASARVEFAPMIERPRDMLMASAERPRSAERPLLGPAAPKSAS